MYVAITGMKSETKTAGYLDAALKVDCNGKMTLAYILA